MMFLPLRDAPRQLPLTNLTFCSYQLTLFTPPLQPATHSYAAAPPWGSLF